ASAEAQVEKAGLPVILKAAAGGGGRGMRIVRDKSELKNAFDMASNEALQAFGDATLFIERYIEHARHVEVQVIGDNFGNIVHVGMRDCTPQRRYQKIIEEALPTELSEEMTQRVLASALALTSSINYNNAGTVEFLVDKDRDEFYFMEVNTRIQVEHPVSEEVSGLDLVSEQIKVAFGAKLSFSQESINFTGHTIECRITAEDPNDDFFPSPGDIEVFEAPKGEGVRVDTHCYAGYTVSPYYDSLLAKLIVSGRDRGDAIDKTKAALAAFKVEGIETNIPFLSFLIDRPEFRSGDIHIKWIENELMPAFQNRAQ
ncbi:MAG: ATP-grasp domain-containing protein, partial [Pseudomonadota bacterium]